MMVWFRCLGEGTSTSTHGPIFHESRSSPHKMIILTDRRLRGKWVDLLWVCRCFSTNLHIPNWEAAKDGNTRGLMAHNHHHHHHHHLNWVRFQGVIKTYWFPHLSISVTHVLALVTSVLALACWHLLQCIFDLLPLNIYSWGHHPLKCFF